MLKLRYLRAMPQLPAIFLPEQTTDNFRMSLFLSTDDFQRIYPLQTAINGELATLINPRQAVNGQLSTRTTTDNCQWIIWTHSEDQIN
jgi:hypothetical protein